MWRIAGSVVLILGGGFWILSWGAMGGMMADDPSVTRAIYLHAVIAIAARGLIAPSAASAAGNKLLNAHWRACVVENQNSDS